MHTPGKEIVNSLFNISLVLALGLLVAGCKSKNEVSSQQVNKTQVLKKVSHLNRPYPTAQGNSAESVPIIKIGLIVSESGPLSPWGNEIRMAVRLAVEEFNKTQEIKGKKLELIIADNGSRADQGKSAAEKLITAGCIGLLGDLTSGITAQIAKTTFEKGIPQISIGGTKNDLTNIGANLFRMCYTDDFQGRVMAEFAFNELNLRNVAVFTDQKEPYSVGLSTGFIQHFKSLGGKIVDQQFYESGQTEFSAQLTNVKQKNPDGLFIGGYFSEVGPIVRQASGMGIDVHKLGGDGWDSDQLLNSGGKAILGSFFSTHYDENESRPEVQSFIKKWKAKYKVAPKMIASALAYDSTNLMINALKRCQKLDSLSLMNAINETENLQGVTGTVTFKNMNGNPKKRAVVVRVTEAGRHFQREYNYDSIKSQ